MKNLTPAQRTSLSAGHQTLCKLWTIAAPSQTPLRFTDLDRDVTLGTDVYRASQGFDGSAIENKLGGTRGNLELAILLDTTLIPAAKVRAGIYDNAVVTCVLVDYQNTAAGTVPLFEGLVDGIGMPTRGGAVLRIRGSLNKSQRSLTEQYSPTCRADLGDSRCKVNVEALALDITAQAGASRGEFVAPELVGSPANRFLLGTVVWSAGANAGTAQEVHTTTAAGLVVLLYRAPLVIQAGDAGRIYPGCAKTVAACKAYGNIANMRAEPYVPGDDFIARN